MENKNCSNSISFDHIDPKSFFPRICIFPFLCILSFATLQLKRDFFRQQRAAQLPVNSNRKLLSGKLHESVNITFKNFDYFELLCLYFQLVHNHKC